MSLRWAIQTNLGKAQDIETLLASCQALDLSTERLKHIPFSDQLPSTPADQPTVFYGATGFVTNIARSKRWSPGVFFEPEQFEFDLCLARLGARMLNASAEVTTLRELREDRRPDSTELFLRPVGDTKEFAGTVMSLGEVRRWVEGLGEENTLSPDCSVVVAEPVGLAYEWRVFMVDGKAVSGSQYRRYHALQVEGGLPQEVVNFAQECARIHAPDDVFVLDVARSGDGLYVIEYNCFNSSGFYNSDISTIVQAVSEKFA